MKIDSKNFSFKNIVKSIICIVRRSNYKKSTCFYCGQNRPLETLRKIYKDNKLEAYYCGDKTDCVEITQRHFG